MALSSSYHQQKSTSAFSATSRAPSAGCMFFRFCTVSLLAAGFETYLLSVEEGCARRGLTRTLTFHTAARISCGRTLVAERVDECACVSGCVGTVLVSQSSGGVCGYYRFMLADRFGVGVSTHTYLTCVKQTGPHKKLSSVHNYKPVHRCIVIASGCLFDR